MLYPEGYSALRLRAAKIPYSWTVAVVNNIASLKICISNLILKVDLKQSAETADDDSSILLLKLVDFFYPYLKPTQSY